MDAYSDQGDLNSSQITKRKGYLSYSNELTEKIKDVVGFAYEIIDPPSQYHFGVQLKSFEEVIELETCDIELYNPESYELCGQIFVRLDPKSYSQVVKDRKKNVTMNVPLKIHGVDLRLGQRLQITKEVVVVHERLFLTTFFMKISLMIESYM